MYGLDFEAIDEESIVDEATAAKAVDGAAGATKVVVDKIPGVDNLPRDDGVEPVVGDNAPPA